MGHSTNETAYVQNRVSCPACQGEGYLLYLGKPGEFSRRSESFVPSERLEPCETCQGEGMLELCPSCLTPPGIRQGRESCRCDLQALPKAA